MKLSTKDYILIGVMLCLVAAIIVIIFKDAKIEELEYAREAYDVKVEEIQKRNEILQEQDKVLVRENEKLLLERDSLLLAMSKTPTDNEVINTVNINLIAPNGSWTRIDSAINLAINDSIHQH